MDRRSRPPCTRRRSGCGADSAAGSAAGSELMRVVALSLFLLAAGCGGNSYMQLTSSGSPATGVSTGGSVHVQGSSTFAALLAIGILAGASYASDREYE